MSTPPEAESPPKRPRLFRQLEVMAALIVWMAGTSCTDFAAYGLRRGLNGLQMRPFTIWVAEILEFLPDLVIWEITMIGTVSMLTRALLGYYGVMEFPLHPWQFGKPAKRPRRLAVAWRQGRIAFHGSLPDFLSIFE